MRKVATLTDGSQLPTLLTAVRPASNTQEFCEEGLQHDEEYDEEGQGPSLEYTFWGIDFKPNLPGILALSTILGAVCMMTVQVPTLSRVTLMSQAVLSAACSVLYVVTLGCMTYCAFADPGQVKRTRNAQLVAVSQAHPSIRPLLQVAQEYDRSSKPPRVCDDADRLDPDLFRGNCG